MEEQVKDANTEVVEEQPQTLDESMDEFYSKQESETPTDSSSETKQEGEEESTDESATAEVDKTEQIQEVDDDESLSADEKLEKIKELLGDDEEAVDAYVKSKGYHTDPAWQKRQEQIDRLKSELEVAQSGNTEMAELAEEWKQFRDSPDYIRSTMQRQGYTQEAIDRTLREKGLAVDMPVGSDLELIARETGLNLDEIDPANKATINDVSKVVDIILQDRLTKILPSQLEPIQQHIGSVEQTNSANKMVESIKSSIASEGVLDYVKDIEPALNAFLDKNPNATQMETYQHFKAINHTMSIERLKAGNRKQERTEKKSNLRQNTKSISPSGAFPQHTGNVSEDIDNVLDHFGYTDR